MFGLIGKCRCVPGRRRDVIAAMQMGGASMPGCRSYVIAEDPTDVDCIWVTEVWDTEEQHTASLQLQAVKDAIAVARPLIAGFEFHVKTKPVAGV